MFSKQAAAILTNLLQAGFSAPQAAALQSLFGQTQQPIVHGGPVQLDYTRQDMRLIGPDDATLKYQGCILPTPQNFPADSAGPNQFLDRPRQPGQPPHRATPDTRLSHGKENKPGGFMPAEHLPIEPPFPNGPGEEPQFPGQPSGPNSFNGQYFPGEYIKLDDSNKQISLDSNDDRRHAVFPGLLNRRGMVSSVEFVDRPGGNTPEFIRLAITEQPEKTIFSVETTALQKVQYLSGIDMSEIGKVKFERQEAWVFGPKSIDSFVTANCCCSDCDCEGLSLSQPSLAYSSADCPQVLCPTPDPEVCECPAIEGTIPSTPNGWPTSGPTCRRTWEGDIADCDTILDGWVSYPARLYVTITCYGEGNWSIGVTLYKSFGDASGQIFAGVAQAQMCAVEGKLTGSVDVILANGLGDECTITITLNP